MAFPNPHEVHLHGSSARSAPDPFALRVLGADTARLDELSAALADAPVGTVVGRVARVDRGRFQLMTAVETLSVSTSGVSPVAVGDWCQVVAIPDHHGQPGALELIRVFSRRSELVRQASGKRTELQALATNIDTVMILVPLDRRISPQQVERFLALALDSGATPVLILTKVDLVTHDVASTAVNMVKTVTLDLPVLTSSVVADGGMDQVAKMVTRGQTVALLGTSGSGKSSMVNAFMGAPTVATGAVRESDAKGRHTTTWRELLVTPGGAVLIDTPGLRELGMWITDEGIDAAFSDVTDLEPHCRFNDCSHLSEPGCAVLSAIATGALPSNRLASYQKLQKEAAFAARKVDLRLAKEEQKMWKQRELEGRRRARP
ncbi:MAG TPA: ribosome small subunit-dependent GTPase A [Acidimicrobiales bacterium]|nr:ribosome small subunit-dependent GTPase A [Acidimicrobiales bacterium]